MIHDRVRYLARLSRSRRHRIYFQKLNVAGQKSGKEYRWDDLGKSAFPPWVYFSMFKTIQNIMSNEKESINYVDTLRAALSSLQKAGKCHGFRIEQGDKKVDLYWTLEGHFVAAWQIHYGAVSRRNQKKLLKSRAWYRFVLLVHDPKGEGKVFIKAQKTRD
jgi:hypothetical protein